MSPLRLHLFGPPRLEENGRVVEIGLRKAEALLAYLAVNRQPYSREALAALLWPESDAGRARANLRGVLHQLNQILGQDLLQSEGDVLQLKPDLALWLDTKRFDELSEACLPVPAGDGGLSPECQARLAEAAELYSDDFLSGFSLPDSPAFDEWQFFEAERLRRVLARLLEALAEANRSRGEYGKAIEYARRRLSLDELHEPAHRLLMELYADSGQTAAALRQYEICAQTLREELDLEPEPETRALLGEIRTGAARPRPDEAARPSRPAGNLPAQATPFVGRQAELETIQKLLLDPSARLVTLSGPGGSGKTRLAIQAAASLMERSPDRFPDGAFFVPLAPLESASSLVPVIAEALDFSFYKENYNHRRQLIDFLRPRRMLLVLDNYEHLLEGDGIGLPVEIMKSAPGVSLLVTSRTRLNVQGEQLFPVAGMQTPPVELEEWGLLSSELAEAYSAVSLFVQSARRTRPDFRLTDENILQVVQICRLVQGMPLALELAASWMELLSPAEIAAEIERSLDFLETDWRDVPERQRSIRAVFDASWKMLTEAEREAFMKMAVFRGGFSRPAAQQVAEASLRTLLGLVNKSWLQRQGESRFTVHELLRQYALEGLKADPEAWRAARDRHSAYYAESLAARGEALKGPQQMAALDAIAADFENIRTAWTFAIDAGAWKRVWRMLYGLVRFCYLRMLVEELLGMLGNLHAAAAAMDDLEARLLETAVVAVRSAIRSNVEGGAQREDREELKAYWKYAPALKLEGIPGFIALLLCEEYAWVIDQEAGMRRLEEAVQALHEQEEEWLLGRAYQALGPLYHSRNDYEKSREFLLQSLAIWERLEDRFETANTLRLLGYISVTERDYARAEEYLVNAREFEEQMGDIHGTNITLLDLGNLYIQIGRFEEAWETFRKVSLQAAETGNRRMEAYSLGEISMQAVRYGDLEEAKESRRQSLEVSYAIQDVSGMGWGNWEMGEIHRVAGDFDAARKWYDRALQIFDQYGLQMGIAFYHRGVGDIALRHGDYAGAYRNFESYRDIADQEHFPWSVAYALNGMGRAALGLRQYGRARGYFTAALETAWNLGNRGLAMGPLAGLADWCLATGQAEVAAELAAFILGQYVTWNETRRQAQDILQQAAGQLSEEAAAAAEQRGREQTLEAWIEKWLEAGG